MFSVKFFFPEIFLILRIIQRDIIINVGAPHPTPFKGPLFLLDFNET